MEEPFLIFCETLKEGIKKTGFWIMTTMTVLKCTNAAIESKECTNYEILSSQTNTLQTNKCKSEWTWKYECAA